MRLPCTNRRDSGACLRPNHRGSKRAPRAFRIAKAGLLVLAAMPVFQTTGCIPDILGALNFELQSLINTTLISAVNIIVQNLLGI